MNLFVDSEVNQMNVISSWLRDLTPESIQRDPFPLRLILQDSLYYPSCGTDGAPVRHLAGNILSFVYVDYGVGREELLAALSRQGFSGYKQVASRWVREIELAPNGWAPSFPAIMKDDPQRYSDHIKQPFCLWSVFERSDHVPVAHGPLRLSLLYLCADGVAAYQALYVANAMVPRAVAVIQPGHAFGHNWTDFTDPQAIFARTVLDNPAGSPQYLLYGGYGRRSDYGKPCWPEYAKNVCFLDKPPRGNIGLWEDACIQKLQRISK